MTLLIHEFVYHLLACGFLVFFVLWIVSEFRWKRSVRIIFGILFVSTLILAQIILMINVAGKNVYFQRYMLREIEHLAVENETEAIVKGIDIYNSVYEKTGDGNQAAEASSQYIRSFRNR